MSPCKFPACAETTRVTLIKTVIYMSEIINFINNTIKAYVHTTARAETQNMRPQFLPVSCSTLLKQFFSTEF